MNFHFLFYAVYTIWVLLGEALRIKKIFLLWTIKFISLLPFEIFTFLILEVIYKYILCVKISENMDKVFLLNQPKITTAMSW